MTATLLPQSVARSYKERYQEVSEELKALNGVKQKMSSLEEEIKSLLTANKVGLTSRRLCIHM